MSNWQRAIIIGASSGMGRELAAKLAASGTVVAAVARRTERLEELAKQYPGKVLPFAHDVTQPEEVSALFQRMTAELGGLDLMIYASGVMPEVGPDEFSFEKDAAMIEVNITGAVAWLNQAAIRFGGTGQGTIVGIGSVAGDRGRVGQPVYNASKAFLATYLEALRNRLSKKGVKVVTIKPGPVQTEMTAHLAIQGAMPVGAAADIILSKMRQGDEHYLKAAHRVAFWIIRHFPSRVFRKLKV